MSKNSVEERSFFKDVERHRSFYVFAQILPIWKKRTGKDIKIVVSTQDDGVMFDFGFSDNTTEEEVQWFMFILGRAERLQELQLLIDEMKNAGSSDAVVRQYVMDAEILIHELKRDASNVS